MNFRKAKKRLISLGCSRVQANAVINFKKFTAKRKKASLKHDVLPF